MTKDEVLAEALECMEAAIKSGDWKVDGACDPTMTIERMKHALEAKDETAQQRMNKLPFNDSFERDEAALNKVREFMRNH